MRTFSQKKLWRDKMIDLLEQKYNSKMNWHILNDQEFNKQIRIKLLEEAKEVVSAPSRDELIEELADLYEVIDSLIIINNIPKETIIIKQEKKRNEYGGFTGKKFVETAQYPVGSYGEQHCLADPQKYPEII